jgi:hypothetical protein
MILKRIDEYLNEEAEKTPDEKKAEKLKELDANYREKMRVFNKKKREQTKKYSDIRLKKIKEIEAEQQAKEKDKIEKQREVGKQKNKP